MLQWSDVSGSWLRKLSNIAPQAEIWEHVPLVSTDVPCSALNSFVEGNKFLESLEDRHKRSVAASNVPVVIISSGLSGIIVKRVRFSNLKYHDE